MKFIPVITRDIICLKCDAKITIPQIVSDDVTEYASLILKNYQEVMGEAKKELDLLIAGFKLNAKEDTLFQRMSIGFLEKYRKKWHGD